DGIIKECITELNVLRCLQVISRLEVRLLEEQAAHFQEEEHNNEKDEEEYRHTQQIVHGVVRVERDTVFRNTVFVFVLLDLDTVRVVGANFVQRQDVQDNQAQQDDRQGNHVQCEEAVQGNTGDQVVTANPQRQVFTDYRDGTKQVNDNLGTPV